MGTNPGHMWTCPKRLDQYDGPEPNGVKYKLKDIAALARDYFACRHCKHYLGDYPEALRADVRERYYYRDCLGPRFIDPPDPGQDRVKSMRVRKSKQGPG